VFATPQNALKNRNEDLYFFKENKAMTEGFANWRIASIWTSVKLTLICLRGISDQVASYLRVVVMLC
jgi:hypothetical protein